MANTYACRKATSSSSGERDDQCQWQRGADYADDPGSPSKVMKLANTFSVMCPASILANRLTLCEIGRERNDSTDEYDQGQDIERDVFVGHEGRRYDDVHGQNE